MLVYLRFALFCLPSRLTVLYVSFSPFLSLLLIYVSSYLSLRYGLVCLYTDLFFLTSTVPSFSALPSKSLSSLFSLVYIHASYLGCSFLRLVIWTCISQDFLFVLTYGAPPSRLAGWLAGCAGCLSLLLRVTHFPYLLSSHSSCQRRWLGLSKERQ